MTNRRQEIENEITRLQEELASIPEYDWENMSTSDIAMLLKTDDGSDGSGWNKWASCPVGSLLSGERPYDPLLLLLGELTAWAARGQWQEFIRDVRRIARRRLEELAPKV